jgi:myo-inositol-1(or 4)-monophosphatase
MDDYREFTITIAREAGSYLRETLNEKHTIEYKGDIDIVTEADKTSEAMLISQIQRRYPEHSVLSEESAAIRSKSEFRWIIDPLDGTTNYAHNYPVFCVSIAVERSGAIILGVIYYPMLDEMFVAEKGNGAYMNDVKIAVSRTPKIAHSLLATGFPYDIKSDKNNNMNYFNAMAGAAQAIRRAGSAALDMAYVAAGRFDGFWELKLHPWDTAAGWLLVKEAGGMVTELFGGAYHLDSPHILASNGLIHQDMIAVFRKI